MIEYIIIAGLAAALIALSRYQWNLVKQLCRERDYHRYWMRQAHKHKLSRIALKGHNTRLRLKLRERNY